MQAEMHHWAKEAARLQAQRDAWAAKQDRGQGQEEAVAALEARLDTQRLCAQVQSAQFNPLLRCHQGCTALWHSTLARAEEQSMLPLEPPTTTIGSYLIHKPMHSTFSTAPVWRAGGGAPAGWGAGPQSRG